MNGVALLPRVVVVAGGTLLDASDLQGLAEVRVQQRLSLPALCELVFTDPPGPLDVAARLAPGTPLAVHAGDQATALFSGEVTVAAWAYGPAGQRTLRVRGYDLLHRLRKRRRVVAHVNLSVAELAAEMVTDIGLVVAGTIPGPLWPRVIQQGEPDLQLLSDLAARAGLYLTVRDNVLHLVTLTGIGDAIPLVLGDSLLETHLEVSREPATRSVSVQSWNPRLAVAGSAELQSGSAARLEFGAPGQRTLTGQTLPDDRHAAGLAQAELDRYTAYEKTLWGIAAGDTRLRPATPVTVAGVEHSVAGRYVVTAVTHTIDATRGFVSELSSVPPAPPDSLARPTAAALGIVTQVTDPQNEGRIRVSLPAYGDVETEWLQVLSPGAGRDKGLMILPGVGDRVLVLLANGEPAEGTVLGGLYGPAGMPDSGVEGGDTQRYTLLTAGGQRVQLDDAAHTVRVEDSHGSYVELSPDKVLVHATTRLELDAPGQAVVIRGASIDFEHA